MYSTCYYNFGVNLYLSSSLSSFLEDIKLSSKVEYNFLLISIVFVTFVGMVGINEINIILYYLINNCGLFTHHNGEFCCFKIAHDFLNP